MKIPTWKQRLLYFAFAILLPSPTFERGGDGIAFSGHDHGF